MDIEGEDENDIFPTLYLYDNNDEVINSVYMEDIVGHYINLKGIKAVITDKCKRNYGTECVLYPCDFSGWVIPNSNMHCIWFRDKQGNEYHDKDFDADDWTLDTYEN